MRTAPLLRDCGLDPEQVAALLRATLAEDLGEAGDITSAATVPAEARLRVAYVARVPGVVCGLPLVAALAEPVGDLTTEVSDGARVEAGQRLAVLEGRAREVLALERTSLNLLTHLSGIATATRAWADAVAGTRARVRDTRKTTPLLRSLEKYAVRCGGGVNHRTGLYDAILVKDNHVAAAGGVGRALDAAYAAHPRGSLVVQVEVDTRAQLDEALAHGAEQVLLDNFTLAQLRAAVERVRSTHPEVLVEASGGLTLADAAEVAATGVDFLAVGALTHSAPALDIGLDVLA
ncbi:MAG TPA: carboxylating nicotinate-nucleotide diphosphorylase [Nocardioides sp.]|jgi:nicotinate-nucleotide pyrophosphorylase (carboxylating)|uniref:carboxylating nicotinate-nucleotide diphosphorylase n=1 Tax=Nocardioides sp. TaxID=35761 RepID=UPI002E2FF0C6|nr:carboxylating nicotinate-nucleotide diphosphorylase [Nocardioides sp.]HEX3931087.1 carboxylating nicotinate-nucleotide diphosphorylase [Nocardioides sp.]